MAEEPSNHTDISGERRRVRVKSGLLEGKAANGVWEFMGIPYAEPPIGELRWAPPQPVKPWRGVRPCAQFGESCAQPDGAAYQLGRLGEDCLYLNIWIPENKAHESLPVMVWIHGGAFLSGSASIELRPGARLYDGGRLAERGVIVVTINYRLGPFGFLAHPLLSAQSPRHVSGNYGMLDQIAALKWVAENIEAFGGDASRVTLFGQSAGAVSIYLLMLSTLSARLFCRVICQSGPLWIKSGLPPPYQDLRAAQETGEALAGALGCGDSPRAIDIMRTLPEDDVIKAAGLEGGLTAQSLPFGPVVDGWVLQHRPESLFSRARQHKIDLLAGWTLQEADYFMNLFDVSPAGYESYMRQMAGPHKEEALALFPIEETSLREVFAAAVTAFDFEAPVRFVARCLEEAGNRSFLYMFTRVPPGPEGQDLCACHGSEIPYVFGDVEDETYYGLIDLHLSDHILEYFTNFARNGDPNSPGLPPWPSFDYESEPVLQLGDEITVKSFPHKEACDLAERIHRDL